MGIPNWKSLVFAFLILSAAIVLFPSSHEMNLLYRQSQWLDYTVREATRGWTRNPADHESALSLVLALRQRGELKQAAEVARTSLARRRRGSPRAAHQADPPGMRQILFEIYQEQLDMARAAEMAENLFAKGESTEEHRQFLKTYYTDRQNWPKLAEFLETRYAREGIRGGLPWGLVNFYQQQRNLAKLETLLQRYYSHDPEDLEAMEGLILVYEDLGKKEALLDLYEKRAQLRPENPDYALTYAEALMQRGLTEKARREVARTAALPSMSLEHMGRAALLALDLNMTELAEPLLIRVAETSSPAAPWWERAGIVALESHRIQDAKAYLLRAYAENPQQGEVARLLGEIAQMGGRPPEATAYWDVYLAGHPENREVLLAAGDALTPSDPAKARRYYSRGLRIPVSREDPRDQYLYATLLQRTHHKREAYQTLQQIEKHPPAGSSWLGDLAELAIDLGQFGPAEDYLKRLEKAAPESDRAVFLRAQLLSAQERWVEAIPALDTLARKHPEETGYKRDLAWAYYSVGNWRAAEQLYRDLLTTRESAQSQKILWEIAQAHHSQAGGEASYRHGPGSKKEASLGLSYSRPAGGEARQILWRPAGALWHWAIGWHEFYAERRRLDDSLVEHTVSNPRLSLFGERQRRWRVETALHGFFGQQARAVAPEARGQFTRGPWTLGAEGKYGMMILDPSEALDVNGRQDYTKLFVRRTIGPWEIGGGLARRGFRVDSDRNPFTGASGLGSEVQGEVQISRTIFREAPYLNVGYGFISSHWDRPFDQAADLLPWLPNQRTHVGTMYGEKRFAVGPAETLSAGISGGRDLAREVWIIGVLAQVTGVLKESWRWTLGAEWLKDSGPSGSGSSATVRAGITRIFGAKP